MPSITAAGVGSGLDIESLISGLMSVERRPLNILNQRQGQVQTQISAIGELSSAISEFRTSMDSLKSLSSFEIYKANTSDDTVFTAIADSTAVAGSYAIDFSQASHQLAVAHKMQSGGFADSSTSIAASGTMKIEHAALAKSFSINIDGSNDSLEGIRDTINNATDNIGVTASIITVDGAAEGTTVSKLVLSSDKTGEDSSISLTDTSGNVASTLSFSDIDAAQNAVFSLDGNTVTSQSNSVQNAIQGVTIDLLAKGTTPSSLSIENDVESVTESVQGFVDAYNKISGELSKLREGGLSGDNSLLRIESRMRSIFNTAPTGLTTSLSYLSDIGITTTESGDLSLDASKLESQLKVDFDSIAELLADDDQGYVFRFESMAKDFLDLGGIIDSRKDSLNRQSDDIDDRIASVEYRLEVVERRYRAQFTALDGLIANLNTTGSFLTQQLGSLPGLTKPK